MDDEALVLKVISENPGLTYKPIAKLCSKFTGQKYERDYIKAVLTKLSAQGRCQHNEEVRWFVSRNPSSTKVKKKTKRVLMPDLTIAGARNAVLELLRKEEEEKDFESFFVEDVLCLDESKHLYRIELALKDGEDPTIREDMDVCLYGNGFKYDCKAIYYDAREKVLSVSAGKQIKVFGKCSIKYEKIRFTVYVYNRLENLCEADIKDLPIYDLLRRKNLQGKDVGNADSLPQISIDFLHDDHAQLSATKKALQKSITFIWGPPGTGKSQAVASILRALYEEKDKTVVCCNTNAAIDSLLVKFIKLFEEEKFVPEVGKIFRAGRSANPKVIETKYLYPEDSTSENLISEIKSLRREVKNAAKKLNEVNNNLSKIKLLQRKKRSLKEDKELVRLREEQRVWEERFTYFITKKEQLIKTSAELKRHKDKLIEESKIVSVTHAGFVMSDKLFGRKYGTLIVDEAGMMSMPYLLAIAQNIFKRVILVGDPKQLGPIADVDNRYLTESVFDYCNAIDESENVNLAILNTQRRSHPNIVSLLNQYFYDGNLFPDYKQWKDKRDHGLLKTGKVVEVYNLENHRGIIKTKRVFGKSSFYNDTTYQTIIGIIESYRKSPLRKNHFNIGIIAPYKCQIQKYRHYLAEKKREDEEFYDRIDAGTIHTFQGSERDLIIFDIVAAGNLKINKTYQGTSGVQLVNVAISRAKMKLIIVGDTTRFAIQNKTEGVDESLIDFFGSI